jgi:hypothetical protein
LLAVVAGILTTRRLTKSDPAPGFDNSTRRHYHIDGARIGEFAKRSLSF